MILNRPDRHAHLVGDALIAQARRDILANLDLARGQGAKPRPMIYFSQIIGGNGRDFILREAANIGPVDGDTQRPEIAIIDCSRLGRAATRRDRTKPSQPIGAPISVVKTDRVERGYARVNDAMVAIPHGYTDFHTT